tara:strand:+ start:117 stop:755 length:639 start_codon:yes stop_codon:yes gene_type:complete
MNTGTKVTVGIGAFMLIGGILATVMGAGAIGGAEDWRPTDDIFWEGESGTDSFVHVKEGVGTDLVVFVTDDIRCDDFTLEIQGGEAWWKADTCIDVEGRSLPMGYADDPEGWLHLGTIVELEDGVEYTITTSHDVVLVGWEVIEGLFGDFLGGLAAICGGPTFLCCGLIFLLIGIVMALTQKGNEKTETRIEINQEIDSVKGDKNWYDDASS